VFPNSPNSPNSGDTILNSRIINRGASLEYQHLPGTQKLSPINWNKSHARQLLVDCFGFGNLLLLKDRICFQRMTSLAIRSASLQLIFGAD